MAKIAGPMQKKIIQVGIEKRSIIQARPVVVPKVSGIAGTERSIEGIDNVNGAITNSLVVFLALLMIATAFGRAHIARPGTWASLATRPDTH